MTKARVQWWRTSFGSEEAQSVADAIAHEHVSMGPVTVQFEREFAAEIGVPYAVATTSGSVALLMALKAVGVGHGDEVIIPNRTFIAPAHAALMLGGKVVLVDVLEKAPVMDPAQVEERITEKTKAIVPVHLNGRAVDMYELRRIADKYGLAVVEDACQAMFSSGPRGLLGTLSDVGCFSLGVTKLISTGQGGVAVTKSKDLHERLKLFRTHGVIDTFSATYDQVGLNFRFTDMLAAIGLVQLHRRQERTAQVCEIYGRYAVGMDGLNSIRLIPVNRLTGEIPLYVEAICLKRDQLICFLEARAIQARPFHPSLNESPHLENHGEFPNSDWFARHGLFLPCGPAQPMANVDRVIDTLREFDEQH